VNSGYVDWHPKEVNVEMIFLTVCRLPLSSSVDIMSGSLMRVLVEGEDYMYESDDEQVDKIKYLKASLQVFTSAKIQWYISIHSLDPSSSSTSPKRAKNAGWTSSVRSLACRLRPFFLKASREHSCG